MPSHKPVAKPTPQRAARKAYAEVPRKTKADDPATYTKTPHEYGDILIRPDEKGRTKLGGALQRDLVYWIERNTWGNAKRPEYAKLSLSQLAKLCGSDRRTVARAIADLQQPTKDNPKGRGIVEDPRPHRMRPDRRENVQAHPGQLLEGTVLRTDAYRRGRHRARRRGPRGIGRDRGQARTPRRPWRAARYRSPGRYRSALPPARQPSPSRWYTEVLTCRFPFRSAPERDATADYRSTVGFQPYTLSPKFRPQNHP